MCAYGQVGCVSGTDGKQYTVTRPNGRYNGNSSFNSLNPGCTWVYTGGTCTIQGGVGGTGLLANIIQDCDLDTNVIFLILGSLGFGFYFIRKQDIACLKELN